MCGHDSLGRPAQKSLRSTFGVVLAGIAGQFFAILIFLAISTGISPASSADSTPGLSCNKSKGAHGMQVLSAGSLRNRRPGRFLIIAHRGYSSAFEENSLDAFKEAIAAGADIIETDVRQSIDKIIVLSHADVEDDTARDLEKEGVIPLEPLLRLAKGRIVLLLDMKDEDPAIFGNILEVIKQHDMGDQVVFGLRSVEQTRAFRKLNSNIVILGFLSPRSYDFPGFYKAGGDIARLWEGDIDASLVKEARGDAMIHPIWITPRVRPDPTGQIDYDRQGNLMKNGFDGVFVNDPESATESRCMYFRKINKR
jgi:glycerophosphoryl diester phosphodiesterase